MLDVFGGTPAGAALALDLAVRGHGRGAKGGFEGFPINQAGEHDHSHVWWKANPSKAEVRELFVTMFEDVFDNNPYEPRAKLYAVADKAWAAHQVASKPSSSPGATVATPTPAPRAESRLVTSKMVASAKRDWASAKGRIHDEVDAVDWATEFAEDYAVHSMGMSPEAAGDWANKPGIYADILDEVTEGVEVGAAPPSLAEQLPVW